MHVLKFRWLAVAVTCLTLTFVAGCQIDSSTGVAKDFRYLKISPDANLHAAANGYIYEFWILSIDQDSTRVGDTVRIVPHVGTPTPLVRFNWDPYLYAATDAAGNFLPLTSSNGMELTNIDVNPFFDALTTVGFITVEPVNDPTPDLPNGPTIVAQQINQQSGQTVLFSSWAILPFFQIPPPVASFSLLSQSNKKGTPHASWRDNETEGYGIWFANAELGDTTTVDSVNSWDAYTKTIVPGIGNAYSYAVWIHKTHPESSFSNFGRVLANREPNFEFRDGVVVHAPGRYGPSETIVRPGQPPVPGVPLGADPIEIDGHVVGYRYIVTNDVGFTDTCIVRVDNPALTRCNRDTFQVLDFEDHTQLPKTFRVTDGDTAMFPSLSGLLDVSDFENLNRITFGNAFIFSGWEYEAWLVFTKESGIAPLSLGRFKSPHGFDSGNPYTYDDSRYDRNFHFPGEDFLQNLSSHSPALSGPLDVIHDPRVEKLWITIEPDDNSSGQNLDWAPDEPNTQMIYLSGYIPKDLDTTGSASFPLVVRDLNPSPTGLNEGNFFPTVTIHFLPPPAE